MRRATRFICKAGSEWSYKERLLHLNILPINYWFEYLDLVFLFKCVHGSIKVDISQYVNFTEGRSRRGKTGLYLDSQYARTSCYRDIYFMRITNLWNAIPEALISAGTFKNF
jgi:hypothetical protein